MAGILSNILSQLTGLGVHELAGYLNRRRIGQEEEGDYAAYQKWAPLLQPYEQERMGLLSQPVTQQTIAQLEQLQPPPMPPPELASGPYAERAWGDYEYALGSEAFRQALEAKQKEYPRFLSKSLTPFAEADPLAGSGAYWGTRDLPTGEDVTQALSTQKGVIVGAQEEAKMPFWRERFGAEEGGRIARQQAGFGQRERMLGLTTNEIINRKQRLKALGLDKDKDKPKKVTSSDLKLIDAEIKNAFPEVFTDIGMDYATGRPIAKPGTPEGQALINAVRQDAIDTTRKGGLDAWSASQAAINKARAKLKSKPKPKQGGKKPVAKNDPLGIR